MIRKGMGEQEEVELPDCGNITSWKRNKDRKREIKFKGKVTKTEKKAM